MDTPQILREAMAAVSLDSISLRDRLVKEGLRVSRQRMHRWLKGASPPEPSALPALCHVLRLGADDAVRLYHASGVPLPAVLIPAQSSVGTL